MARPPCPGVCGGVFFWGKWSRENQDALLPQWAPHEDRKPALRKQPLGHILASISKLVPRPAFPATCHCVKLLAEPTFQLKVALPNPKPTAQTLNDHHPLTPSSHSPSPAACETPRTSEVSAAGLTCVSCCQPPATTFEDKGFQGVLAQDLLILIVIRILGPVAWELVYTCTGAEFADKVPISGPLRLLIPHGSLQPRSIS